MVLFTALVFATGVALLLLGPSSRDPLVLLHKISFFAWIAVTALHILGHLPEITRLLSTARASRRVAWAPRVPGARGRSGALAGALLAGLVLAVALLGQFSPWTH